MRDCKDDFFYESARAHRYLTQMKIFQNQILKKIENFEKKDFHFIESLHFHT